MPEESGWQVVLEALIKVESIRKPACWAVGIEVPDEVTTGLRALEHQAVFVRVNETRYAVYLTNIGDREVVAIDPLR